MCLPASSYMYIYQVYSRGDEQHEITSLTTRYNYKVDVYSFAFIFWEMLTNRTPYDGQTKTAITQAVIQVCKLNADFNSFTLSFPVRIVAVILISFIHFRKRGLAWKGLVFQKIFLTY